MILNYSIVRNVKLVKHFESILEPEDPEYRLDLTGAAYSFSWQYDGKRAYVPLSLEERDLACVAVCEQVEDRKIKVVYFLPPGSSVEKSCLEALVMKALALDEDLSAFYEICSGDPILRGVQYVRGLHLKSADAWTSFLIAVSQQNASFRQGWYMLYRLHKTLGRQVYLQDLGRVYILPPKPEDIVQAGEQQLRACGYGYRARIVLEVAKRIASAEKASDILNLLKNVKGVGPYTYGLTRVIARRDYSVPVIDRWVKGLYEHIGIKSVEKYFKETFKNYQGLATWFLTIILDAEPLSKAIERVSKGEIKPKFSGLTPLTMWRYW